LYVVDELVRCGCSALVVFVPDRPGHRGVQAC
jgi:hypothetical protein